jgi:hypothetical protein
MRRFIPIRLALWGLFGILLAMPGIAQAWTSCLEFHKATASTCCEQPVDACGCEEGVQEKCACVVAPDQLPDQPIALAPSQASVVVLALADTPAEVLLAPVARFAQSPLPCRAPRAPPDIGLAPDSPRGPRLSDHPPFVC